ncbi:MAG: ExbD/TolR family protein [Mariniblastus sp.]
MKLSKHKPPSSLAFNMTPMIDIVFLLIIFFMTVSQITRTVDYPLPLPRVTEGDTKTQNASITINLDQEGTMIIGGRKLSTVNTMAAIQQKLTKSGNDPSRVKVQIRVDRNCECGYVTELLENLANLGFTNVRSAVSDN